MTDSERTATLDRPGLVDPRLLARWQAMASLEVEPAESLGWLSPPLPGDARELLPAGERYTFGEEVARGGMGSVTLARDNLLGRTVAIKRLLSARPDEEDLRRFLLEAQVTGQLEHPSIVDVHDVGVDEAGRPYFTMQYVRDGETLEAVIGRLRDGDREAHARYTLERRVQIVERVARAVEFAHRHGVIHRDIKPANIMVGRFGEVLLVDWGLARVIDAGARARGEERPALNDADDIDLVSPPSRTDPDRLLGTPLYMAPEQITAQVEERSDVYALAAVLHELLSLTHYLGDPAQGLRKLSKQIQEQPPVRADAGYDPLNGRVPQALADLILRGLTKDPDERLASAGQLADSLQDWLEGHCPVRCPNSLSLSLLRRWKQALQDHPGPATLATLAAAAVWLLGVALGLHSLIRS